ncbi:MAG: 2-amino-3,7-dideoxy-D-threo-hept-6-ulosonate synthase, partial [Clostridium sp.]
LSCSTNVGGFDLKKIRSASVDEAIAMGCDGVSIHVNIGNEAESYMLEDFANISEECSKKGMPLIAMMYARGPEIENEYDVKYVKHIARIAEELGADIVKVNYTGDIEGFREVVQGCQIPVVIAGGEKQDNIKTLIMINDAMIAGARGISIGRNIFQQEDKELILKAIKDIVYNRADIDMVIDRYMKLERLKELNMEVAITK